MAQGVGEQVILMAPSNLSTNKSSTGDRLPGNILVSPVLFTCQVCRVSVLLRRELLDAGGGERERGKGEKGREGGLWMQERPRGIQNSLVLSSVKLSVKNSMFNIFTCVFFCISISVFFCLCVYLPVFVLSCLFLFILLSLSVYLYVYLYLYLSICICVLTD